MKLHGKGISFGNTAFYNKKKHKIGSIKKTVFFD